MFVLPFTLARVGGHILGGMGPLPTGFSDPGRYPVCRPLEPTALKLRSPPPEPTQTRLLPARTDHVYPPALDSRR